MLFGELYNTIIPSTEEWKGKEVILPNEISVYTANTGSGFYCKEQQVGKSLRLRDTSTTVFQAEMLAIKKAAELYYIRQILQGQIFRAQRQLFLYV